MTDTVIAITYSVRNPTDDPQAVAVALPVDSSPDAAPDRDAVLTRAGEGLVAGYWAWVHPPDDDADTLPEFDQLPRIFMTAIDPGATHTDTLCIPRPLQTLTEPDGTPTAAPHDPPAWVQVFVTSGVFSSPDHDDMVDSAEPGGQPLYAVRIGGGTPVRGLAEGTTLRSAKVELQPVDSAPECDPSENGSGARS